MLQKSIVNEFVEKYYTDEEWYEAESYIIGEDGDLSYNVVSVQEEYRHIENMREALYHKIPKEVVREWREYADELTRDSGGKKYPTNLVSYWKGADKIELTEEEKEKFKQERANSLSLLDREIEKNKSEEYKMKEEQRKKDYINVGNEHEWDMFVSVYRAKQLLKDYHIKNWELF